MPTGSFSRVLVHKTDVSVAPAKGDIDRVPITKCFELITSRSSLAGTQADTLDEVLVEDQKCETRTLLARQNSEILPMPRAVMRLAAASMNAS